MSKRKKLKNLTALKTTAQKLKNMGQGGDTELVHVNKYEEKVLEKLRGGKLGVNPKTGLKEANPLLIAAGVMAAGKVVKGGIQAYRARKSAREDFTMGLEKIDAKRKSLMAQKRLQPTEAQALARLRKGAEQGTMDVQALNQQMAQPMYQQGQAQQAQAMGQITRQGLEGSVIAQEASRKVGTDVRANIAEQARQIAFKIEQSKAQAEQRLQEAMFKRGDLLREIAGKSMLLDSERRLLSLERDQKLKDATAKFWGDTAETTGKMASDMYKATPEET